MAPLHFEILYSRDDCVMLRDAEAALTTCDLWDWLRDFTPHANDGFMFSTHPNLTRLTDAMTYTGHSGSSYAWTMRVMENIAKNGWHSHVANVRRQNALLSLEKWARKVRVTRTR